MKTTEEFEDEGPSKSERKREMDALQNMGERLIDLSLDQLETIELSPVLKDAVLLAKRITSHGALRRQKQYIGRLMRKTDLDPILQGLNALERREQQSVVLFHHVEKWRDKLVQESSDTLSEFLTKYPTLDIDRQQLRQLIKRAQLEFTTGKPAGAGRVLFRFLNEALLKSNTQEKSE